MNLGVVLEMIGVGLLLTLIASAASVLFIMRYDPLNEPTGNLDTETRNDTMQIFRSRRIRENA